jgi:hypothetical protein
MSVFEILILAAILIGFLGLIMYVAHYARSKNEDQS